MSKRKRCSINRPTKKQRLDTVALINQLQDEDEDRVIQQEESGATKAVDLSYNEARRNHSCPLQIRQYAFWVPLLLSEPCPADAVAEM